MNTAIIMLGANINQEENLMLAKEKLNSFFEIIDESTIIQTKPIGKKYSTDFYNQALKLITDDTHKETERLFKLIENEMGRSSITNHRGEVPIDILEWHSEKK